MKEWITITGGVGLAVVASALTGVLTSGRSGARAAGSTAEVEGKLDRISESLREVQSRHAELERRVAALAERNPGSSTGARTQVGGLDAAVASWMERNALVSPGDTIAAAPRAKVDGEGVDAWVRQLLSGDLTGQKEQELWQKLREEGHLDEVVAEFERMAEADPSNPDAQVDLGNAYLQKVFEAGSGPMAGVWATKADESFDQALALDENHWEARFMKAVSLSNWPAFLGKSSEAIHQFETLIGQQEQREPQSPFAQSYYFLGNMYQQTGENQKALEAWKRGLALFPDNELLRQQIALAEAGR